MDGWMGGWVDGWMDGWICRNKQESASNLFHGILTSSDFFEHYLGRLSP